LRIIEVHPNGLVVITIRRSKTNQRGDDEELPRGLDGPSVPRRHAADLARIVQDH
jgi:hypothetical protein